MSTRMWTRIADLRTDKLHTEVKNKAWLGLHASLRDLIYDWTNQAEAPSAL